jgi:hypothetical protein
MMLNAKVIEPQDIRLRIESLADGLTLDTLVETLRAAVIAYDGTSALAPPTTAGFNFWSAAVEQIRETLIPKGWSSCNRENFSVIVSPCRKVRIACGRGSIGTGRPEIEAIPTTRSKKGPRTIAAIHANSHIGQYPMEFVGEPDVAETWFLLYHREGDFLYTELSLPGSYCDVNRRPDGWIERIPLPPISVDPARFDDSNNGPDFDVTVKRRS